MTALDGTTLAAAVAVPAAVAAVAVEPQTGDDRSVKRHRLLSILAGREADALVLTSAASLSWYFDGARVHVSIAGDPVIAVVVTPAEDLVVVYSNEADRLTSEELPAGTAVETVRWDRALVPERFAVGSPADRAGLVLHESDIVTELQAARASLLPGETARYAELCRDSAALMTRVLERVTPSDTERHVAAELARATGDVGAEVLVVLAAGRSRLRFRHPTPGAGSIGDLSMFVLCARRNGLIANLTRWVRFGPPEPVQLDAERRILEVEADFFRATVPGAALADVFAAGISSYSRHGFEEEEWTRHHQGGPCGYNGRDPRASIHSTGLVAVNHAFAWNPSAPGAKVEDTVLFGADGPRVLTVDPAWPTVSVNGLDRPVALPL